MNYFDYIWRRRKDGEEETTPQKEAIKNQYWETLFFIKP